MNGERQKLQSVLGNLRNELNKKKQVIKSNIFLSDEYIKTFELFLSIGVNYYLENCKEPYSNENKRRLMTAVIDSVLEQSAICAKEYREYHSRSL